MSFSVPFYVSRIMGENKRISDWQAKFLKKVARKDVLAQNEKVQ